MSTAHLDPTTGEWVGDHATMTPDGEVTREVDWFATKPEALAFSRTGKRTAVPATLSSEGN